MTPASQWEWHGIIIKLRRDWITETRITEFLSHPRLQFLSSFLCILNSCQSSLCVRYSLNCSLFILNLHAFYIPSLPSTSYSPSLLMCTILLTEQFEMKMEEGSHWITQETKEGKRRRPKKTSIIVDGHSAVTLSLEFFFSRDCHAHKILDQSVYPIGDTALAIKMTTWRRLMSIFSDFLVSPDDWLSLKALRKVWCPLSSLPPLICTLWRFEEKFAIGGN
jgi:hypothetical protein